LSRPYSPRTPASPLSFTRVNGKIRAREVRVIDTEKKQLGVMQLSEAIAMARNRGVDLVEIAPNANPPVCRLVDFGKYRYEIAKQEKEARKHQHANKVKEVQLSPNIDQNDFKVKLQHGINFLCEDMKVKITLRFRGREMAHKEFGFQVVNKFVKELLIFAHPDSEPKLIGKGITVMLSPLPRNKRAKNPHQAERDAELAAAAAAGVDADAEHDVVEDEEDSGGDSSESPKEGVASSDEFTNNPFSALDLNKNKPE
jgi:translation initiation factor IF-3